jgi:hypothetical protein
MELPDEFIVQLTVRKFLCDDAGLEIADAFGEKRC